ncbi:MAG: hypothetical protein N4A72_09030 [Bacteroidales bacterium]|jgi:uncharacterized membrane protein|nr:hypothetical protein [Bacteroidales bacterium]
MEYTLLAKVLGILGLILAILSLIFGAIPCFGFYALTPAIVAVALSTVSLILFIKSKRRSTIAIVALSIGVLAIVICIMQYYFFGFAIDFQKEYMDHIEQIQDNHNK